MAPEHGEHTLLRPGRLAQSSPLMEVGYKDEALREVKGLIRDVPKKGADGGVYIEWRGVCMWSPLDAL